MSVDFKSISEISNRYNFHSHTQFCDGRATMAEFAKAAVAAGVEAYGFTPHSPLKGVESPCNMSFEDVEPYFDEVERLREAYAGRAWFYAGMEIDYLDEEWGPANEYFRTLPLDYSIGSVHFIPSDDGYIDIDGRFESFKLKMERHFHNDIRHVVESFYRQSRLMLEAGGFDILGHFDKISHNASHFQPGIENTGWYKTVVNEFIDLILEKRPVVELNTKAWHEHHRMFPSPELLPRLLENGITIVVNSDAHYPDKINAGRPEGVALIGC